MIITPAVKPLNDANLELPQNNSRIKLLTISRLHWIKGLETSIEAVKLLKSQGIDFEYHIVGDGNIKETERYQFLVKEYELQDDVIFHGKLSHQDTLKFLEFCDIYLQPSISEGFCNAVLEAQSYGKLCIVSETGGLVENIVPNVTGWLVPKRNPNALANKIKEVINLSPNEKQMISIQAIERITPYFSMEEQQRKFVMFYEE